MPRKFSAVFARRLGLATIRFLRAYEELKASDPFPGGMKAVEDQFRQITGQYLETSKTFQCLISNRKIEEFEKYIDYHKELQAINELEQAIIAEAFSKLSRNAESHRTLLEILRRTELRQKALLKRRDILREIDLTLEVIKALNKIVDEEVFQIIETENASDKTDEESTTVEEAERKISSEADNGGSTAGTMEKVEESLTDGKLTTSEKQSSEILPGQSSEEQLAEVKQSPSEIDQSSIADRIESQQELSAVAGRSNDEAIELQNRNRVYMERLDQMEQNLRNITLWKKWLGLPEEAPYTDEKSKERFEKISSHFQELDELFDKLETAKKEFLEL